MKFLNQFLFLLALFVFSSAQSAEAEIVNFQPGDSWTYQFIANRKPSKIKIMYTIENTHKPNGDVMYSSRILKEEQPQGVPVAEGFLSSDICIYDFFGKDSLGLSDSCFVKLDIGRHWSFDNGNAANTAIAEYKVIGNEEISVPAGSFNAIRIDGTRAQRPRNTDGLPGANVGKFLDTRMTYWFAPSVKAFVKIVFDGRDENGKVLFETAYDLAAFRPAAIR